MAGLSEQIAPLLPYLRRYARALSGSQELGDAYVAATLECIIAAPAEFPPLSPRIGLYQVFHAIWRSVADTGDPLADAAAQSENADDAGVASKRLLRLTPLNRQALLLTVMEGFSNDDAAAILGMSSDEIAALVAEAMQDISRQTATDVLIIEDEPLIAMDLQHIVTGLGHRVLDVAPTRDAAVTIAQTRRPGLVLADIQLADGSSGIDAVHAILGSFEVPVIFITAFPDRLLMGTKPEPTFLITKPYQTDQVKAAVSQALFFERTARVPRRAAPGDIVHA